MATRSFFYALWCLAVLGLFMIAAIFGWSPFAEGGRAGRGSGGGGTGGGHYGYYGPHHK